MDDYILNFIINLAKGATKGGKRFENRIQSPNKGNDYTALYNCRYLLEQIVRQYELPKGHRHISVEANGLWKKITTANIRDYEFTEKIKCDALKVPINVKAYKGNGKTPTNILLYKDKLVKFNDIFTTEHTIPVCKIVDELVKISTSTELSDEQKLKYAKRTLGRMHLCILTKEEDKRIAHASKRSMEFRKVLEEEYKPAGITLLDSPIA